MQGRKDNKKTGPVEVLNPNLDEMIKEMNRASHSRLKRHRGK